MSHRRRIASVFAILLTQVLIAGLVFFVMDKVVPRAASRTEPETHAVAGSQTAPAAPHRSAAAPSASAKQTRPTKSYAFYVGRNLTEDGNVLLGGTGEEPSSHWLDLVPHQQHAPDEHITVGVTPKASIPGKLTKIPQVDETYKYITMRYSEYSGFPAPLTNGGLNEHQVAIRDVWSPSREELVKMTPQPQTGPNYSDLARVALQRAKTAREAVEIIGGLIDEYGYSTYGGNTHIVADRHEGWVIKELAGGRGLWVAERLGPNEIRASYPGYIGDIPANHHESPDHMGSDNLIPFAIEQGWYAPDSGKPFNVHEVYGAQDLDLKKGPKLLSPKEVEQELRRLAPVSLDEMMALVRDPRIADDEAGYGQVARLRADLPHPETLATLWVAPTGSVTAPFVPWHMGVQTVLPEFRKHRYLTKKSAPTFLDRDFQSQEATKFAGRVFKRLMYYTCARPKKFLPEVTNTLDAFEKRMLDEQRSVEHTARTLIDSGEADEARKYLTYYSNTQATKGLDLGTALVSALDARTKVLGGVEEPRGKDINRSYSEGEEDSVDCLVNRDPDVAGENDALPTYVEKPQ